MSKLTDEAVYCEYDRDINHKFMACEKCQHNMKIEATKAQPTNSIDSELERLLKAFAQSMQINEQLYHSGDNSLKTRDIDNEVSINNALQAIKALYRKEIEEAIGEDKTAYGDNLPCIYDARQMIESNNALRAELRSKLLGEKNG